MTVAALTFLAAGSASAFASTQSTCQSSSLSMVGDHMFMVLPFLVPPKLLDGSLAGDIGFDPLSVDGGDKITLATMCKTKIKHCRLVMLTAVGWPLAKVYDWRISGFLGLEPALTSTGASPSILKGGLDKIEPD